MASSRRQYRPEWVSDYRRSRRWVDSRTVLARMDGEENLGRTHDLSVGGMKVEFTQLWPLVGRRMELAVVFGDRVVDLSGTVLHRSRQEDGATVGIEFDQPLEQDAAAFFSQQYPPTMEAEGSDFAATA